MTDALTVEPVFHAGEHSIQDRIGITDSLAPFAQRVIRDHIIEEHAEFYAQLPMLNVGAVDKTGQPWATAVFGKPGFIETIDDKTLGFNGDILLRDELELQVNASEKLGLLGLQPVTRRRNRLNGSILSSDDGQITLGVDQSFGNCPQYIQSREFSWRAPRTQTPRVSTDTELTEEIRARVETADTFFIASRSLAIDEDPRNGIDVSHRGGRPGFISVTDGVLSFPDFRGNNYFNTLGNINVDNRVGLFFPDFETGHALFLTGEADVVWDDARVENYKGAQRIIDVRITKSVFAEHILPLKDEFIQAWPPLKRTNTWAEVRDGAVAAA